MCRILNVVVVVVVLLQLLLKFFAILVTAAYSNPYILIPAFFIVISFVGFRWYYLKTSRDIKRLEAIGKPT